MIKVEKYTGVKKGGFKYSIEFNNNSKKRIFTQKALVELHNKIGKVIGTGHDLPDMNSKKYQLGLLQNYERDIITKAERKRTINIWLVKKVLTQFTSKGGSTSAYQHCDFLGIDPDGYTFFEKEN